MSALLFRNPVKQKYGSWHKLTHHQECADCACAVPVQRCDLRDWSHCKLEETPQGGGDGARWTDALGEAAKR